MKVCKECIQLLPLDKYYPVAGCKDGHQNICKKCKNRKAYEVFKIFHPTNKKLRELNNGKQ
jgi:hypothetical protein